MAKNKQTSKKVIHNHAFRGCREIFLNPGPRSAPGTTPFYLATDSGGNANFAQVLAPLGLTSVVLASGLFTAPAVGNVTGPPLRGLFNRAVDFQWYRVTRAKLVFVSNSGSTVVGTITLSGYTDPADVSSITFASQVSGPGTRTFDLASGATKELSVPIPVDTAWKRVSSILTSPGNGYPYTAANAATFATVNTVGDLSFGAVSAYLQGGPVSIANAGTLYLDYDIEFKTPVDAFLNV